MATRTASRLPATLGEGQPGPPSGRAGPWMIWIGEEARKLFPAWLFFYAIFSLLYLTRIGILKEYDIHVSMAMRVLIGSLLVAKGLLLVDLMPFLETLEERPILVSALAKTACYAIIMFFLQYLEGVFNHRHEGLATASREFTRNFLVLRFWVLQIWLVLSLFAYSVSRDLFRRLGPDRFRELFIGRRAHR